MTFITIKAMWLWLRLPFNMVFQFIWFVFIPPANEVVIPPANEVAGVYSDPYVRPFVRPSVRLSVPSQSLIHYSFKTAEQNFMKLSGIVHYMMPYCTSYFTFLSAWFWGFPELAKQGLSHYDIRGGGTHL